MNFIHTSNFFINKLQKVKRTPTSIKMNSKEACYEILNLFKIVPVSVFITND